MNAILVGPCVGELWWEIFRFSPHIIWKKKQHNNTKLIVLTSPERFDLYGKYVDIFVPLRINGMGTIYKENCFRLDNYPIQEYNNIIKLFNNKYNKRFKIVEHIYPKIEGRKFTTRWQFPQKQFLYNFIPRPENLNLVQQYLSLYENKPLIALASRYREGIKRNWPHWNDFYDMLYSDSSLVKKYNFIICGKSPDYIPDKENRFLDINQILLNNNSSLIGVTIEILKKCIFTIGSQSGLPNLSLLLNTPVLEWGHQKKEHSVEYNIKKTKVIFLDDVKYNLKPEIIIKNMRSIL